VYCLTGPSEPSKRFRRTDRGVPRNIQTETSQLDTYKVVNVVASELEPCRSVSMIFGAAVGLGVTQMRAIEIWLSTAQTACLGTATSMLVVFGVRVFRPLGGIAFTARSTLCRHRRRSPQRALHRDIMTALRNTQMESSASRYKGSRRSNASSLHNPPARGGPTLHGRRLSPRLGLYFPLHAGRLSAEAGSIALADD
jgi:hypothetical protein